MFKYQASPDLLKDKTILVSGAGAGIGRAAALAYAAHGATVILLGKTVEKLESVYDEIEAAGGPQAAIFPMDLATATDNDYQTLASGIESEFTALDGLLNNAAALGTIVPIEAYSLEIWNSVMQVNVNASFALCKYLLPLLKRSENASIILTSSGAGRKYSAYWGAYCVSKHAVEALMQVMFLELENTSKVRVNTVNPGATYTDMRKIAFPAENPTKIAKPEEVMPVYLYLMGKDSLEENGQALSAQ